MASSNGVDNLRDHLSLTIFFIVFIIFSGVVVIWIYNFMALSDEKLFDANNKYINQSLSNPDIESNYKDTYKNNIKLNDIQLNYLSWFGTTKGIFITAFIMLLFLSLIFSNRKRVMDGIKSMFD